MSLTSYRAAPPRVNSCGLQEKGPTLSRKTRPSKASAKGGTYIQVRRSCEAHQMRALGPTALAFLYRGLCCALQSGSDPHPAGTRRRNPRPGLRPRLPPHLSPNLRPLDALGLTLIGHFRRAFIHLLAKPNEIDITRIDDQACGLANDEQLRKELRK